MTLALFDALKGKKISEDFHVNINSPEMMSMLSQGQQHFTSDREISEVARMANTVKEVWKVYLYLCMREYSVCVV